MTADRIGDMSLRTARRRARAMAGHLRENGPRYFEDLAGREVHVEVVRTRARRFSWIHEFAIGCKTRRHVVLVKVPRSTLTAEQYAQRAVWDRLRPGGLVPLPLHAAKYRLEHAALCAIEQHFHSLNDRRFETIRVLDRLDFEGGIVMERSPFPTLKHLAASDPAPAAGRGTARRAPLFRNAGAWLREFHAITPLDHSVTRQAERCDFIDSLRRLAALLSPNDRNAGFLQDVTHKAAAIARDVLSESLPLVTGHGDFAPHNILVGPLGQVVGFDTLARWRVPVYEDIGYFLGLINSTWPQIISRGMLSDRRTVACCEREFLRGYFEPHSVPMTTVRLFEIQSALVKWASRVQSCRDASGMLRLAKRCRLVAYDRFYRRYLQRLLGEIERA